MNDSGPLPHLDANGRARMVDVTGKAPTLRRAIARATVHTTADVAEALAARPGDPDPIVGARVAALGAAKLAWDLIPLCHPIHLTDVAVEIVLGAGVVEIEAVTEVVERTGVEMEALTACAVAGLAIVGALRDVDPWASVDALALWSKEGGRSGHSTRRRVKANLGRWRGSVVGGQWWGCSPASSESAWGIASITAMSDSVAPAGEPGTLSTRQRPIVPATPRESRPFGLAARVDSARPGASRSTTDRVASGVRSRGANPVPPVVTSSPVNP